MGNTFGETAQELKNQQGFLEGVSADKFAAKDGQEGNDVINLAKDIIDIGEKTSQIVKAGETAMKWIDRLKTGAEVVTLIAHAPEYINNVGHSLEQQAHTMDMKKTETSSCSPEETKEFQDFKDQMVQTVQRDVVTHIVSRVNSAWIEPLLQKHVEGAIRSAGRETIKFIGSIMDDDDNFENRRNIGTHEQNENSSNKSQSQKNHRRNKKRDSEDVLQEHETYADQVNSIGGGRTGGLLEIQQMANYDDAPFFIDDETEVLTSKTRKDKKIVIKPNGREPNEQSSNARHLKITANADSTKHAVLTDQAGNILYEGPPGNELNQCLYEAGARAKGVSTEVYIAGLKQHALKDDRAKYT